MSLVDYRRVKKVRCGNLIFDSKLEVTRYLQLKLLEGAKELQNVSYHPDPLIVVINDVPIFKYYPDFTYSEHGLWVIEDVKGFRTPVFNLKWRALKAHFPHYVFRIWPEKNKG